MRALIVGHRDSQARSLRQLLNRSGYECSDTDVVEMGLGAEYAGRLRADLIIVILTGNLERTLGTVSEIRGVSQATIVLVGPAEDPKFILRALHDGGDEYIDVQDAEGGLERVLQRLRLRRESAVGTGFVTCLLSTVGGAGATTLAANLAVALAHRQKSALFDLCLRNNDLATVLDLKPRHTIADLCRRENRLDATMFQQALLEHASGAKVLAGPLRNDDRVGVTSDGIRRCISLARCAFDHTLLDVDRVLGAEQIAAIVRADLLVLVVRLDLIALRNTAMMLEALNDLGIRRDRIQIVANRTHQRYALPFKRFEQAVDMPLWHAIRDDVGVANRSINDGTPAITLKPRSWLARGVRELAAKLNTIVQKSAGSDQPDRSGLGKVAASNRTPDRQPGEQVNSVSWLD
jgi:pilus assembly protein CpaE